MRSVRLLTGLVEGDQLSLELCSRYMHSLDNGIVDIIVGADGIQEVDLMPTALDECIKVVSPSYEMPKAFWVYAGLGIQEVDLTQEVFPRNRLQAYEHATVDEAAINAEAAFKSISCSDLPLINEEDQRLICRTNDYTDGEEDEVMCRIDNKIGDKDE